MRARRFCRYFDVEERYVFAEEGRYAPTPALMRPLIDENTVGVACILGSTFTGEFEDVRGVNDMLEEVKAQHGWEVYIHVDAASGGFVAPFLYPELVWDFRLPHVASINVSGHKYGLVFPGVGWVIWRDEEALSPDLVFEENYLGSTERSITLNFSKGASQIIAQYYMFLRLGRVGYTKIMTNLDHIRCRFDAALRASDHFEVVSAKVGVPLVAFRLRPCPEGGPPRGYDEHDIADRMRMRGWVLPAYTLPPNLQHITVLRVTLREDFSAQMADEVRARAACLAGSWGMHAGAWGAALPCRFRAPHPPRPGTPASLDPPNCCSSPRIWCTPSSTWTVTTTAPR